MPEEEPLEVVPIGIKEQIEEALRLFQCARGIIEEALSESGLDQDLQRYAKLFENLAKNEFGKCKLMKSPLKKLAYV